MPETQQEILDAKVDFMRLSGFPLCIGAIDGTHVLIQSYGGENAEIYRNRKMVFSHNCQLAVSADVIIFLIYLKPFIKLKLIIIQLLSGPNPRYCVSLAWFSTRLNHIHPLKFISSLQKWWLWQWFVNCCRLRISTGAFCL